jgi:hypothetical protein
MFADRKLVWMLQYIFGVGILIIVLPMLIGPQLEWSEAHGWAFLLFLCGSGISFIDCASSLRLRNRLLERVEELEKKTATITTGSQGPAEPPSPKKQTIEHQLVSSVN